MNLQFVFPQCISSGQMCSGNVFPSLISMEVDWREWLEPMNLEMQSTSTSKAFFGDKSELYRMFAKGMKIGDMN